MAELLGGARDSRSGEPGVGKSALLDHALAHAAGMAAVVESETRLPFAALQQVVRPVLDHLERLPRPQADALRAALGLAHGQGGERFLVSLGALTLLSEAAARRALLWSTMRTGSTRPPPRRSTFVARRLEPEAIALLFATRDGETRRFDAAGLPQLRLGGLDRESAGTLLDRAARSALAPAVRDRLIDGTSGNPLALLELPGILSEEQLAGRAPLPSSLPVGKRLEQAFLGRVRELPADTQTLLLVAAAGGIAATIALALVLPGTARRRGWR